MRRFRPAAPEYKGKDKAMSSHFDTSGSKYLESIEKFEKRHGLSYGLNSYDSPSFSSLNVPVEIDTDTAKHAHELLKSEIREFESGLDDEHEVAVQLASFGHSILMMVEEIGYANPSTLFFYGTVNNQKATLIQHISQLNFLLMSVEKADPGKPPHRIGFCDNES